MNTTNGPKSGRCQVFLVEDHPIFRDHLRLLINNDLEMEVCGEVDNIRSALPMICEKKPDIAIVDITLKGGSGGLELVKDLRAQQCEVPVLVLSMHDEELYAERALRAGARGYISKNEASTEVVKAIRKVTSGEVYVSKNMNAKLLDRMAVRRRGSELAGVALLADRELEVFQLLGRGKGTHDIAIELNLSDSTIDTYRGRIKEKLRLNSAAELYLRAGQWVREHGV